MGWAFTIAKSAAWGAQLLAAVLLLTHSAHWGAAWLALWRAGPAGQALVAVAFGVAVPACVGALADGFEKGRPAWLLAGLWGGAVTVKAALLLGWPHLSGWWPL